MSPLDDASVNELAARLTTERPQRGQLELPSTSYPDMTLEDAYRIQRVAAHRRELEGVVLLGWKIGLVDPVAQAAVGVSEPIAGRLFDAGLIPDGGHVDELVGGGGRVECEFGFLLADDLVGPGVTGAHVLQATAGIMPAFEIIEDRLPSSATVADMIADNCSGAGFAVGAVLISPSTFDLVTTGVILEIDSRIVATGASGAVMGNPAHAVAWLANRLASVGETLHTGQVILTGAAIPPVPVEAGHQLVATFGGGLGSIRVVGLG